MERCDFSAVTTIINHYISEDKELNQLDFVYLLFADFITSHIEEDVDFDNGLVCRWLNGIARVSPRITSHYMDNKNKQNLVDNIQQQIIPMMYDSGMACIVVELYLQPEVGLITMFVCSWTKSQK